MIRYLLYSVFFIAAPVFVHADYPEVYKLDNLDIVFRQFTEDINLSYKKSVAAQFDIPLMIASYKRKDENLFQFSSRVNLPYGTVATLNRLNKPSDFLNLTLFFFRISRLFLFRTMQKMILSCFYLPENTRVKK